MKIKDILFDQDKEAEKWPPPGTKTVIEPIPTTPEMLKYDQPKQPDWPKPGYEGQPIRIPTVPVFKPAMKKTT